jgi:hypothetical protein
LVRACRLGREPTQREFAEHALKRFCADAEVRAMAVAAARRAATAVQVTLSPGTR